LAKENPNLLNKEKEGRRRDFESVRGYYKKWLPFVLLSFNCYDYHFYLDFVKRKSPIMAPKILK
jgi:hypothetical protein